MIAGLTCFVSGTTLKFDEIMCWLLCAIVDHERMVSVITAWGVQLTGLPHSPKTNGDHLVKDLRYCSKTKWQRERKKGGAARNQTQGLWLKSPALCHWTPLAMITLTILSWSTVKFLCPTTEQPCRAVLPTHLGCGTKRGWAISYTVEETDNDSWSATLLLCFRQPLSGRVYYFGSQTLLCQLRKGLGTRLQVFMVIQKRSRTPFTSGDCIPCILTLIQ